MPDKYTANPHSFESLSLMKTLCGICGINICTYNTATKHSAADHTPESRYKRSLKRVFSSQQLNLLAIRDNWIEMVGIMA